EYAPRLIYDLSQQFFFRNVEIVVLIEDEKLMLIQVRALGQSFSRPYYQVAETRGVVELAESEVVFLQGLPLGRLIELIIMQLFLEVLPRIFRAILLSVYQ